MLEKRSWLFPVLIALLFSLLAVVNASLELDVGNRDGTFQSAQNFGVGIHPFSVALGDFNGDNRLDLAVVNYWSDDVTTLINDEPRR